MPKKKRASNAGRSIEEFAEDLGRVLGQAQNKAESWMGHRTLVAESLAGIRDTAARLLSQLGMGEPGRRGSSPAPRTPPGKRRKLSAAGRAAIVAAQKARWAAARKAGGTKRSKKSKGSK